MLGGVFGKGFVHLALILTQRLAQGVRAGLDVIEHIGVKTGHVNGIRLHKSKIKRIGRFSAVALDKICMPFRIHAHIQHCAGPAPIGVLGARAHRDQRHVAEMRQNGAGIHRMARRNRPHSLRGQGHGFWHRHL